MGSLMSLITLLLLIMVAAMGLAHALLWFARNGNTNAGPDNGMRQNIAEPGGIQNRGIQAVPEQPRSQQDGTDSRIIALEEAVIRIQNDLSATRAPKSAEQPLPERKKAPDSDRIKILEDYLKKTS